MKREIPRKPASGDLLQNLKFVKLLDVQDLPRAEVIQQALRERRIGAVIINDERVQVRSKEERENAVPMNGAFRIEVPEPVIRRAREVLRELDQLDEG